MPEQMSDFPSKVSGRKEIAILGFRLGSPFRAFQLTCVVGVREQ
jgi:hypothetical protein